MTAMCRQLITKAVRGLTPCPWWIRPAEGPTLDHTFWKRHNLNPVHHSLDSNGLICDCTAAFRLVLLLVSWD